jgi:hypothetical protein
VSVCPTASPALASALRGQRDGLNARFAMARRRTPALEPEAFGAFLCDRVGPLVEAVAARAPENTGRVTELAFDAALELVGQRLAGVGGRHAGLEEALSRVWVAGAAQIAAAPGQLLAATANALIQLHETPGARPAEWADEMVRFAPVAPDPSLWLALGQVAAWRAGLAHFRESALRVAASLPDAVRSLAVGGPPTGDGVFLLARLETDPWFRPEVPAVSPEAPRVVARVGAFRGFGGVFPAPPTVSGGPHAHFVESGETRWWLHADAFGATLHRAQTEEHPGSPVAESAWRVERGVLWCGAHHLDLPVAGAITSAARVRNTLAVTCARSHTILLVRLPTAP